MIACVLFLAAYFVGTSGEQSLFDEPYNVPRLVATGVLVVLGVVVYLVRGDDS